MGAGVMLAKFENQNNTYRVYRDGPWHFDKCLILVKDFDDVQQVKNICMKEISFWVLVHNLPLMAYNEYEEKEVGTAMETLEEVNLDYGETKCGEFMKIKVRIDITKLL